MDAQAYLELLDARYSVRSFSEQQLSDDELAVVLAAAQKSPSAKNTQPWRFCVVQSAEGIANIDECTPCRYGAPTVIICAYDKEQSVSDLGYETGYFGDIDTSIAITNMTNAAAAAGLGSCWVGRFEPAAVRERFNVPETYVLVELLMLGHPAEDAAPAPRHEATLPLETLVVHESF